MCCIKWNGISTGFNIIFLSYSLFYVYMEVIVFANYKAIDMELENDWMSKDMSITIVNFYNNRVKWEI